MNRRLAETVIATFREHDEADRFNRLAAFRVQHWQRSLHWLDASGLALYFLARLKTLGLEEAIPAAVLSGLESRLADNKHRSSCLFDELLRINQAFQAANLRYVNLKGFTLVPDYCPDSSLRCQFDLDFFLAASDAHKASHILETFGYVLTGRGDNVLEFKAGSEKVPSIRDLYKSRPGPSVEVHYSSSPSANCGFSDDLLGRSRSIYLQERPFPALSDIDTFLAQAHHLLRHVRSEWTRISWLLEFKTFVSSRRDDTDFWRSVYTEAKTSTDGILAIGVALWLATEAFGTFAPPSVIAWSLDRLPAAVRLWLERCGETLLLCDFPGTKLYLLLNRQLSPPDKVGNKERLRKLFPLHRPPRVTTVAARGFKQQGRASLAQAKYIVFRLRFHLVATWHYWLEARRWKQAARTLQWQQASTPAAAVDLSAAAAVDR